MKNKEVNQNNTVDDRIRGFLFNSYYTEGATPFPGLLYFTLVPYLII